MTLLSTLLTFASCNLPELAFQVALASGSIDAPAAVHSGLSLPARMVFCGLTAMLMVLMAGPLAIRLLKRGCQERIVSDSAQLNQLQAGKQGTPTMGGLFLMAVLLLCTFIWCDCRNEYIQLGIFLLISLTALGAVDDWIKLRGHRKGLTVRQKLAGQLVISLIVAVGLAFLRRSQISGLHIFIPFVDLPYTELQFSEWSFFSGALYAIWAAVVIAGTSNAVNLTDGLDGLAAGCTFSSGLAGVCLLCLSSQPTFAEHLRIPFVAGSAESAVFLSGLVGGILGFLWFNCYPAQVFMGDAGSLPVGGLLAFAALVAQQEILLLVTGGVFAAETISVILQVCCFKMTGKRLIRCSPLHNHFLFAGHHEMKIVTRFWIASILMAMAAIAWIGIR